MRARLESSVSLYHLIGQFLRRHSAAYVSSAAMLVAIAVLITWIPRQIGHIVDGLVSNRFQGLELLQQLAWLIAAGAVVYVLRAGWRLRLFAASMRLGVELRERLYARLSMQGPAFFQASR